VVQVAIKRIKEAFLEWNEAAKVREFKAMLAMSQECQHIVPIYELIREQDNSLYFVFEYMPDGTLNDFLSRTAAGGGGGGKAVVEPSIIRSILFQVLQGLEHVHSRGYMHRDLKPENLLMRGMECKVADFSLARTSSASTAVSSSAQQHHDNDGTGMTTYVSTRWYRAPEIILCAPNYSTPVDMFAVGCIAAELYRLFPLFPGSGEVDQLQRILKLLGNLEDAEWPEGVHLSKRFGLGTTTPTTRQHLSSTPMQLLQEAIPLADTNAISLIHNLLQLNPARRLTASDALQTHNYFREEVVAAVQQNHEPPRRRQPTTTSPVITPLQKTNVVNILGHHNQQTTSTPGLVSISPGFRDNFGPEIENSMIPSQQEVYRKGTIMKNHPRDTTMDIMDHAGNSMDPCYLQSPADHDHLRHFRNHTSMNMPRSLEENNHQSSYENDRIQSHEIMYGGIHRNLNSVSPNESHQLGRKIRRVACTPAQAFNVD
jgi:serine/threonine protein kinase